MSQSDLSFHRVILAAMLRINSRERKREKGAHPRCCCKTSGRQWFGGIEMAETARSGGILEILEKRTDRLYVGYESNGRAKDYSKFF